MVRTRPADAKVSGSAVKAHECQCGRSRSDTSHAPKHRFHQGGLLGHACTGWSSDTTSIFWTDCEDAYLRNERSCNFVQRRVMQGCHASFFDAWARGGSRGLSRTRPSFVAMLIRRVVRGGRSRQCAQAGTIKTGKTSKKKGRDDRGLFLYEPFYALAVRVAATLPAALLVILILPTRRTTRLIPATLPATLTGLALTRLTTLLLAVTLSGVTRIRASHNPSNAKGQRRLWRLLHECRLATPGVASAKGMKKGLTHV